MDWEDLQGMWRGLDKLKWRQYAGMSVSSQCGVSLLFPETSTVMHRSERQIQRTK